MNHDDFDALMSGGRKEPGAPPAGFTRLPEGHKCKCFNMWREADGSYWCCNGTPSGTAANLQGKPLTGWSTDYYKLHIAHPTDPGRAPYDTECNDIIEALGLSFAEGNIFKAIWRRGAARMGNGKKGTTALYDAEKVVFFGQRLVEQEREKSK